MPQSRIDDGFMGTATTTAGASATILSSTPPNGMNSFVSLLVVARCPISGDRAYWWRGGFVNKDGVGALTVDKQEDAIKAFATAGLKQADIDVQVSGGTVNVIVIGDAAQPNPVEWQALVRIVRL